MQTLCTAKELIFHLTFMVNRIITLLQKDILLEFRQKHTFYGILLYIASTIFVLYLSIDNPDANVWNGLF